MNLFQQKIEKGIAVVIFDSGRLNTLSAHAIDELRQVVDLLNLEHEQRPLKGVVLMGNQYGLGAGADINELMVATPSELAKIVDEGHRVFFAIENGPFPWLAVIDGVCLGGIYELALACHGIVATERSTVGLPEIQLGIFPGLGGTQRLPRRIGLINETDPFKGDAAFTAILTGKNFKAKEADAIGMIDGIVTLGTGNETLEGVARVLVASNAFRLARKTRDISNAESFKPMVLPTIQKATMGREHPRAPYVALDVMCQGAGLTLEQGIKIERDAFLKVATSSEARAGMRTFFTKGKVEKMPKGLPKPKATGYIGVAGIDGFMGNAIAWLCLEANKKVVGYIPPAALQAMNKTLDQVADMVRDKIGAKYERLVKRGKITWAQVTEKVCAMHITDDIHLLGDCDVVIEALFERRDVKEDFLTDLANVGYKGIVATNSSSMGPAVLSPSFVMAGGDASNLLNTHFFSPAENPAMMLVEIIRGKDTSDQAVATAHAFVRSIGKTPIILADGSPGFLVNAGLAAYISEAEAIYREGTSISAIDTAMRHQVFPMGPFEMMDMAGVDIGAGLFDEIEAAGEYDGPPSLVSQLRDLRRMGKKVGAGFYNYDDQGKPTGEWEGLQNLVPDGGRLASEDEIVVRCLRALGKKARNLLDRGIVANEEEADLCFILGIGFAPYLGGPFFHAREQKWEL